MDLLETGCLRPDSQRIRTDVSKCPSVRQLSNSDGLRLSLYAGAIVHTMKTEQSYECRAY
jgi:hypothetical protein